MARIVDDKTLPNDKFGYRIYGVMAHLPEPQASEVRKLHQLVGATDLATRPHCSLDNFWGPDDLDAVKKVLWAVAKEHAPFETSVDEQGLQMGDWGCAYTLKPAPGFLELQQSIREGLLPVTKRIYSADTPFWPHTTMLLDAKPEEVPLIASSLKQVDMLGPMRFSSFELIGRVGPARGGEYHVLESWPLAG